MVFFLGGGGAEGGIIVNTFCSHLCPSFIKAYYVATSGSFFLTLCFNVGYLSAD